MKSVDKNPSELSLEQIAKFVKILCAFVPLCLCASVPLCLCASVPLPRSPPFPFESFVLFVVNPSPFPSPSLSVGSVVNPS